MMTPEELCDKLLEKTNIPLMQKEMRGVLINTIRTAYAVAYFDAADTCDETASEHTAGGYGKEELEMVARLLRLRATGEEIR